MLSLKALFALPGLLLTFLDLPITPIKTVPPPPSAEMNGAIYNNGAIVNLLNNLSNNGSPVFGNWSLAVYSGTTNVWLAGDMVGGIIRRHGTQSAADITDTAQNIVNAIPGAVPNQTFPLLVANLSSVGTITPQGGTGVTMTGSSTIERQTTRLYLGRVTGSAAVTLTSVFQFPVIA